MKHGRVLKYAQITALVGAASGALCMLAAGTGHAPGGDDRPPCRMVPSRNSILLPPHEFNWLEDEDATSNVCGEVPEGKWIRKPSGSRDLFVYADGPSGSGRFWTITIGIAKAGSPKPARGFCFTASTVGRRTLQKYNVSPLPWLDDVDGDGKAEFVLWDSFPLRADASMAEYGLTAWVYRFDSRNSLVMDWNLSRQLARELAASYRSPLDGASTGLLSLRSDAAAALTLFADDRCSPNQGSNREQSQ